jgi:hypothetical protein
MTGVEDAGVYPNILNHSHHSYLSVYDDRTDRVFRNVGIQNSEPGITQKKAYNIQNKAKV